MCETRQSTSSPVAPCRQVTKHTNAHEESQRGRFFGQTPSRSEILLGQIWVGGSVTTGNGLMFIAALIIEEENIGIHVKYVQI